MPSEEMTAELKTAVEGLEVGKEGGIADNVEMEETTTEEVSTEEIVAKENSTEDIQEVVDGDEETTKVDDTDINDKNEETSSDLLSNEILERAVSIGIPVADARELGPESLGRIFRAHDEESRRIDQEVKEATDEPNAKEEPVDPFADVLKFDPNVHDEATIAAFEKLTGIVKQQQESIKNFETRQEEVEYNAQEVKRRDTVQWFDKQIENLGEDFVDALGTGEYDSLDQGSAQFQKREALANQVSVLLAGYKATGQQAPPRDEVFNVAARLVLSDEYQQIEERKLSGNLREQASQHIQRAGGQRATGKESPLEEAARELDEKYF